MATRTITISDDDLQSLKSDLNNSEKSLTDDQRNFTQYLVGRAETGKKSEGQDPSAMWQWTYRF